VRAHAQRAESSSIAVSYSLLEITDSDASSMPAGWLVSGSRRVNDLVDVVGEVGGNHRRLESEWFSLYTLMAGVRFSPARPGMRPYGQMLGGLLVARCCGGGSAYATLEPGGGVEVPVGSRTAVRVGASSPLVLTGGNPTILLRIQAGMVFRLGPQ